MALLKDQRFYELCQVLQAQGQVASDPDRKAIEKAFRRLALKTHPDKGGDPVKFRTINEAYNKLIAHIDRLERMEAEAELRNTSVIIEISKQAMPKWWEKLKAQYGQPKTSEVRNTIFQGPYKQYKGRGKLTGPITLILYEDPEDKIPKIHCKCENYMAWIQEQKMPLHLHVDREKKIMFDQWRIMSLAEYNFINVDPGSSARHDWKNQDCQSTPRTAPKRDHKKEQEEREKKEREEEERKAKEREEEEERRRREEEEEEAERIKKEKEEKNKPWWHQYADRYKGFNIGETTPPPEGASSGPPPPKDDGFPKVYNMTANSFTKGGLSTNVEPEEPAKKEEPPVEVKEEPPVEEAKPETKKARRARLAKAQKAAEMSKEQESSKEVPKATQPDAATAAPKPQEAEPAKISTPEPVEPTTQETQQPIPDEVIESEPSKVHEAVPETKPEVIPESIPMPEVKLVKKESIEVIESEPTKLHKAEPTKVVQEEPVVVETVEPSPVDQQEPDATGKEFSEADLNKRDIGKIAEKLVNKSKIKKLKTKKTVLKKKDASVERDKEDTDEKENKEDLLEQQPAEESLGSKQSADESSSPGSKARKRPLEDTTQEWTSEGGTRKPDAKINITSEKVDLAQGGDPQPNDFPREVERNEEILTLDSGQVSESRSEEKVSEADLFDRGQKMTVANSSFPSKAEKTESKTSKLTSEKQEYQISDIIPTPVETKSHFDESERTAGEGDVLSNDIKSKGISERICDNGVTASTNDHFDSNAATNNIFIQSDTNNKPQQLGQESTKSDQNSESTQSDRSSPPIQANHSTYNQQNGVERKPTVIEPSIPGENGFESDDDDDILDESISVRRGDVTHARRSISQQGESMMSPRRFDKKSLSPFSSEYNESSRRLSSDTVPSRWRRGSNYNVSNPARSQGSSRSSISVDETVPAEGEILRSKSVHLLYREHSPKVETPFMEPTTISSNTLPGSTQSERVIFSPPPRERRSNSMLSSGVVVPPPPPIPPPPLPESPYIGMNRKFKSSEHVEKKDQPPPRPSATPASTFTIDHFVRPRTDILSDGRPGYSASQTESKPSYSSRIDSDYSTSQRKDSLPEYKSDYSFHQRARAETVQPDSHIGSSSSQRFQSDYKPGGFDKNLSSRSEPGIKPGFPSAPRSRFDTMSDFKVGINSAKPPQPASNTDKIPSRFRRARDHAAAASTPDLPRKVSEYSVFHEEIKLARSEHQRCCDEAKNYDQRKSSYLNRSSSSSNARRSMTPGPTFQGPPPAMPAPPAEVHLRRNSSRFGFTSADLSKSKSMRNLSSGIDTGNSRPTYTYRPN